MTQVRPRVLHFVTGGFSGGATQVAIQLVNAGLAGGQVEPLLVLRRVTERPAVLEGGTVVLVGTNTGRIVSEASHLLRDEEVYEQMSRVFSPYGDGHASEKIVARLLSWFGESRTPSEFE